MNVEFEKEERDGRKCVSTSGFSFDAIRMTDGFVICFGFSGFIE